MHMLDAYHDFLQSARKTCEISLLVTALCFFHSAALCFSCLDSGLGHRKVIPAWMRIWDGAAWIAGTHMRGQTFCFQFGILLLPFASVLDIDDWGSTEMCVHGSLICNEDVCVLCPIVPVRVCICALAAFGAFYASRTEICMQVLGR
jgi:hypothetical protein